MPSRPVETILLHLHGGKKSAQRNPSIAEYRAFFQAIDSTIALGKFIRRDLSLSDDLARLAKSVSNYLRRKKKNPLRILVLELLDPNAGVSDYDDCCFAVHDVLRNPRTSNPRCIVVTVAHPGDFKSSEFLKQKLKPLCERKSIDLLLLGWGRESDAEVLSRGKLPHTQNLPQLRKDYGEQRRSDLQVQRSSLDIERKFDILFGHFEVEAFGKKHHVPAVASVKKLVNDEVFIHQLHNEIALSLNSQDYQVMPLGIPLGGIDALALKLVEGDGRRRLQREDLSNLRQDARVVLLCDFVSPVYPLQDICNELRAAGTKTVLIVGVASYADALHIRDVKTLQYVTTNYKAASTEGDCAFCKQGVPLIQGEDYVKFARHIRAFDSFTFWELIKENPDYYRAGHWKSDRTLNHYQFRIMVEPLLKRHCHGISLRLRNLLESTGILPNWIDKIMCVEEVESQTLSLELADILGKKSTDVIAVRRSYLDSIAGADLGKELSRYLDETHEASNLIRQNVVIVDQAAHHFKTLGALRTVCENLGLHILAFTVVVDRTDAALDLGDYLHDSHYVSLYTWPSPPRLWYECPCARVAQ